MNNMCKYCKDKGMSLKEYKEFKKAIETMSISIKNQLSYNGGMYYNINTLPPLYNRLEDQEIKNFIIQELKKLNIEFIENNTMYRIVD